MNEDAAKEKDAEEIIVSKKDMYQVIIIDFSNGSQISANIPAQFYSEDDIKDLSISKISISNPLPLPDDVHFEKQEEVIAKPNEDVGELQ